MITDEQYRKLEARVTSLEKKLDALSQRYSSLYMKNDMHSVVGSSTDNQKKKRDVTRYVFQNEVLCKRRLVLKCVKWFVETNGINSSASVIEAFPDYIQGPLGIIKRIEEAEKYAGANNRYFFSDEDIIHLSDGDFVVCSQWDKSNIYRFLSLAKDMGIEIEEKNRKYC